MLRIFTAGSQGKESSLSQGSETNAYNVGFGLIVKGRGFRTFRKGDEVYDIKSLFNTERPDRVHVRQPALPLAGGKGIRTDEIKERRLG